MDTGLLLAPFIALTAYFVRGIAGFGSALVASPLLAQFYPLTLVVPLVVVLDNSGSILQAWRHRAHIAWRDLWPLLPFSLVGIAVAMQLHQWLASCDLSVGCSHGTYPENWGYETEPSPGVTSEQS